MLWLRGKVHRQRWVEVKFPGAVNMVDLSQVKTMFRIILRIAFESFLKLHFSWKAQLREQAMLLDERKEEKEQQSLGKSMIRTIYSDEVSERTFV